MQERENLRGVVFLQIHLYQPLHGTIVFCTRMAVHGVPARMPAEIAIKLRADVVKLVEDRDEFLLEWEIQKAWQAECDDVFHFHIVHTIALNAVFPLPNRASRCTIAEAQWRKPGDHAVAMRIACRCTSEKAFCNLHMRESRTS